MESIVRDVNEVERHPSPAAQPQPLAFHRGMLWTGCWGTSHLYAIDPRTWTVVDEVAAPGKPFGLAAFGDELRVVVSIGEDDDRYFYGFVPGAGFDAASKTPCPDFTGSHLTSDGETLYLVQATNSRILMLDAGGAVLRELPLMTRCAGLDFRAGALSAIVADDEFERLRFATAAIRDDGIQFHEVAVVPSDARGLASDGTAWWTCLRDLDQIISFTPP